MKNQTTLSIPIKTMLRLLQRAIIIPALAFAPAGCGLVSTDSPFWATLTAYVNETRQVPVTRDYVNTVPYASMLAQFEGAGMAFLVLANAQDGRQYWRSATGSTIVTSGCWLVQSSGLRGDIRSVRFVADPGSPAGLVGKDLVRLVDGEVNGKPAYDVKLTSHLEAAGSEIVEILNIRYDTRVVTENLRLENGDMVENRYWLDPASGQCLQSRQQVLSTLPPLTLRVTRAYSGS